MNSKLGQWIMVALVIGTGSASAFAQANGPQGCNAQTLRGSYAFRSQGGLPPTPPQVTGPVSSVAVGIYSFDGQGGGTGANTGSISAPSANVSGFVSKNTFSIAYTVNSDCTGTLKVTFPWGAVLNWDIAIADNGKKILGIVSDQGFALSLEGTKQ